MQHILKSTSQLLKRGAIRTTLNALGHAGIGAPAGASGAGLIMTLHRVEPTPSQAFQPNAHLTITPAFLATVIEVARDTGMKPIPLSGVRDHIANGETAPFIAFTLDDGYRNNAEFAAPVFEKYNVPYTIFVSKGLSERTHTMWWETAAKLFGEVNEVTLELPSGIHIFPCQNLALKHHSFAEFANLLLEEDEDAVVHALNETAKAHGICAHELTKNLVMDRAALKALNQSSLCHYSPHTVSHINLAKATPERLEDEIKQSVEYIREHFGDGPDAKIFSYPYGKPFATSPQVFEAARKAGMEMGVTTEPGSLVASETNWHALPRMSINGYYQSRAAAKALLCGVPTLLERRAS